MENESDAARTVRKYELDKALCEINNRVSRSTTSCIFWCTLLALLSIGALILQVLIFYFFFIG